MSKSIFVPINVVVEPTFPRRYLGRRVVVLQRSTKRVVGHGTITRAWVWTGAVTETPHGPLAAGALSRAEVTLDSGQTLALDARTPGEHSLDWEHDERAPDP